VATYPPLFTEARDPLEADHWLRVMESKFSLLCCTEVQKTLFVVQQLHGDTIAWWANYTVTCPADYQCRGLSSVMPSTPTTSPLT
jgi:hypothetical protein